MNDITLPKLRKSREDTRQEIEARIQEGEQLRDRGDLFRR